MHWIKKQKFMTKQKDSKTVFSRTEQGITSKQQLSNRKDSKEKTAPKLRGAKIINLFNWPIVTKIIKLLTIAKCLQTP